jgi:hypothetical protein
MRTLTWDRSARIAEVRDRIWSYVSPASRFEAPGLLVAAALLKWPEADALRLGELQFLLSDEVGEFLDAMPRLVRRLATSSASTEQWTIDRLPGPVQWNRTLALRASTGSQQLFVTTPAHRVYQTSENELLAHVLDAVPRTALSSGWDRTVTRKRPAQTVRERVSEAMRWQQSRMLASVDRTPPTPRSLSRIRSGRTHPRYAAVLAAYEKLVSLVEQLDRDGIRAAVEHASIVAADEATLFELLTTFYLLDALREQGWQLRPFHLFRGRLHLGGTRQDGRQINLWYQSTPPALTAGSRYRQILTAHGFSHQHELRPDIVLQWTDQNSQDRWLLVECKLSQAMGVTHAARQALLDLLSYRRSFDAALTTAGRPYGLGVAWGAGLLPADDAEVALCTPDTLHTAVRQIVT